MATPTRKGKLTGTRAWGIYGANGSGKTKSLGTWCEAGYRLRVYDADGQAKNRLASYIKKGLCEVIPWRSFEPVAALYADLVGGKQCGFDVVAFDTVSIANEEFVREDLSTEAIRKTTKKTFQTPDWGDRKPAAEMIGTLLMWGKDLADPDRVAHPVHVVYTMHEDTRMVAPTGSKADEKGVERIAMRGPALPGRFLHRGGGFMSELYHLIVSEDPETKGQFNHWFVTHYDGEWPAKCSDGLDQFEEPDFGAILKKLEVQ